jgi:spore photoproduct lyase
MTEDTSIPAQIETRERRSNYIHPFSVVKPGILCCKGTENAGLHILSWAAGCPFDCDYCYLQGTFHPDLSAKRWSGGSITIYEDGEKANMMREVEEFLASPGKRILHTGELSDSLGAPGSFQRLQPVINKFAEQERHKLLLLTKSRNVDELLSMKPSRQAFIGFSVNPPKIADLFEHDTATPPERLEAARKCADAGYPVLLRVDPMIPIEGWEDIYGPFIEELNSIDAAGVAVGTIRAFPRLRSKTKFAPFKPMLTDREFDGRWRLSDRLRFQMYDFALSRLHAENVGICKESGATIWGPLAARHHKHFTCNCLLRL